MPKMKLLASFTVVMMLIGAFTVAGISAAAITSQTIFSNGTIIHTSQFLAFGSSLDPSKNGASITISGKISTGNGNSSINIQYSQNKLTWTQIATINADSEGKFSTPFIFPSSGNYFVRAVYNNEATVYTQTVTDLFVNLNGKEDFTDMQSAIDALPSTGGTVYLRSGLYELNGNPLVLRSNLTIIGDGIDQTTIRLYPTLHAANMPCEDAITASTSITNLIMQNFTIIQNVVRINHHGVMNLRGQENSNITLTNLKLTDASGGGIGVCGQSNNVTIENCIIERVRTGIGFADSTNAIIRNNTIRETTGDGILFMASGNKITIENNQLTNIGDTAIDITCQATAGELGLKNVMVRNNLIQTGTMRISNALNVQVINNVFQNGHISVDAGQGRPTNIKLIGNQITSSGNVGIGFYGAFNSSAEDNTITLTQPSPNVTQSGIAAAIWGNALIRNNTIINSANYGIDFGNWSLGGSSNILLQNNMILNYGVYGIYDNNVSIQLVHAEGNTITSQKPTAQQPIYTQYQGNTWTITP
jgi:parallel beta-helix repeat protein